MIQKIARIRHLTATVLLALAPVLIYAQTLEEQALSKITTLQALITTAEDAGLEVSREQMTLHTAELFLDWANWDEANVSTNRSFFDEHPYYDDTAQEMAEHLPDFEREGVIEILDHAIAEINLVIDGHHTRPDVPEIDWSAVSNAGNNVTYNNRPVFLADYVWKPESADIMEYYGQLDGHYITPNYITNDQGSYNTNQYSELAGRDEGRFGSVFLDNNVIPSWAISKYPDIQTAARIYGKYDPDHAGSREMYSLLFEQFVPHIAGKKFNELGYMLFNEPSFHTEAGYWNSTDEDGICVSDSTIKKFKWWLEDLHGSISTLNTLWGTGFASFDAVSAPLPMPQSHQGSPMWYDWMTFNNHRITDWFTFLKSEIRKHDPQAKVHIKLMPHLWSENHKDHGMEFEALTELSDISGCDAGAQYLAAWGDEPWTDKYTFNWREAIMTFDFFKSVKPNQFIYDSENHFLTKTAFAEADLNQDYLRCIYWLGMVHGLSVAKTWVWGREADGSVLSRGSYNSSFVIAPSQQPKTLNTVTRTFMDANSRAEELYALQNVDKPIRVFYSKTSSINDNTYMDEIFDTYSSVFFEGAGIGFATENILNTQTANWEVVLVRATETVTDSEFTALQNYLNAGGTVIVDINSLKKDEYFQTRSASLQAGSGKLLLTGSLSDMKTKALQELETAGEMPPVNITETNASGNKTCTWRWIRNDDGNYVVSMTNLGKSTSVVTIDLPNASIGTKVVNMLSGVEEYAQVNLDPYEVHFVEVIDARPSSIEENATGHIGNPALHPVLYPNPTDGLLQIDLRHNYERIELILFNSQGQEVMHEVFTQADSLTARISDFDSGMYIARLNSGSDSTFVKVFKN